MSRFIPYGRQDVTDDDIDAVVRVLRSDFLTQGPVVPEFETALAEFVGARHAVATNSATSALHAACHSLDLGPGDSLWTSPITFVASSNCALYCGASVDFVDIEPDTYNLSAEALRDKLVQAKQEDRLPKVVVVVHFAGLSCDMAEIGALSREYGFRVIEDASHAIGATYDGQRVGNCRYSDITVFSFHPVKIITTAEGGIATTNDETLHARMAQFRSHGITRRPEHLEREAPGDWYYEQQVLGFNYRMTDLHAALGLSQLTRVDEYVEGRELVRMRYDEALATLPLRLPAHRANRRSALHLYPVLVNDGAERRDAVFGELRRRGVGVNLHYIPVYLQPYYRRLGFRPGYCPVAEWYFDRALSLPMFPRILSEDQDRVIADLGELLA